MRISLQPAYILHSRPYRESSLLLEAMGREHGRIGLVARGARGARSRWKNMLQPFRPLLLSWTQRGELGTLTGADQVASPPALAGEPLFCGLYANELMIRFLQRSDPHPGLFDYYQKLLTQLSQLVLVCNWNMNTVLNDPFQRAHGTCMCLNQAPYVMSAVADRMKNWFRDRPCWR